MHGPPLDTDMKHHLMFDDSGVLWLAFLNVDAEVECWHSDDNGHHWTRA